MNRADCDFVDTSLDHWVAGRLNADLARRVEAHIRECERCRRLEQIVRAAATGADWPADEGSEAAGLSQDVLQRTSGDRCERAQSLLPALVDGELDEVSRDILSAHLAHCQGCADLAAALAEAREVLPSLAEAEPPPGFTARVLAHTSRAPHGWALSDWWLRIVSRPRASMELAYIGAVLLVVIVGNPVLAFRGAGQQARRFVGAVPVDRLAGELRAKEAAAGLVASTVGSLLGHIREVGAELTNRWLKAKALAIDAWDAVMRAATWARTLDWTMLFSRDNRTAQPDNKAPPGKNAK